MGSGPGGIRAEVFRCSPLGTPSHPKNTETLTIACVLHLSAEVYSL